MLLPTPVCSASGSHSPHGDQGSLGLRPDIFWPLGGCQVPGGPTAGAQRPEVSSGAGRGQSFAWGHDVCSDTSPMLKGQRGSVGWYRAPHARGSQLSHLRWTHRDVVSTGWTNAGLWVPPQPPQGLLVLSTLQVHFATSSPLIQGQREPGPLCSPAVPPAPQPGPTGPRGPAAAPPPAQVPRTWHGAGRRAGSFSARHMAKRCLECGRPHQTLLGPTDVLSPECDRHVPRIRGASQGVGGCPSLGLPGGGSTPPSFMSPDRGHTWTEPEPGGSPHLQHTELPPLGSTSLCISGPWLGTGPRLDPVGRDRAAPRASAAQASEGHWGGLPLPRPGREPTQRGSFHTASVLPGV